MFCGGNIICHKVITIPVCYIGNLLVIWDYFIDKAIQECIDDKNVLNFLNYVFIYAKLIDRGLKKYMFCDAIIITHKVMTGNIYYQWISKSTWDYLIEKDTLDCINDKNVLNFLFYVLIRSS